MNNHPRKKETKKNLCTLVRYSTPARIIRLNVRSIRSKDKLILALLSSSVVSFPGVKDSLLHFNWNAMNGTGRDNFARLKLLLFSLPFFFPVSHPRLISFFQFICSYIFPLDSSLALFSLGRVVTFKGAPSNLTKGRDLKKTCVASSILVTVFISSWKNFYGGGLNKVIYYSPSGTSVSV